MPDEDKNFGGFGFKNLMMSREKDLYNFTVISE